METDTKISAHVRALLAGLLIAALVALVHRSTLVWLVERYRAVDSYYSHGFLVPVITCALIWARRRRLAGVAVTPGYAGLLLCVISLAVHAAGIALRIHFTSGFALFSLVAGMVLFLYGPGITRRIIAPLGFLVFMMPLPLVAINSISFPLKAFVARHTGLILQHVCGLPLRQEGFRFIFPNASLTIENPCSGLRSLIVMLALGFVFACLSNASVPRRAGLFLLSVPVAIVSNMVRVLIISMLVYVYGERMAQGFVHDLTGYIAFACAFLIMRGAWRGLQCGE